MADDQRPDTDASEDARDASDRDAGGASHEDARTERRGLGRFASRFRRERARPSEDPSTPASQDDDATAAPEGDADDEAPWLVPAALNRTPTPPEPEPLAPELDLTVTPPIAREPEDAEAAGDEPTPAPASAFDTAEHPEPQAQLDVEEVEEVEEDGEARTAAEPAKPAPTEPDPTPEPARATVRPSDHLEHPAPPSTATSEAPTRTDALARDAAGIPGSAASRAETASAPPVLAAVEPEPDLDEDTTTSPRTQAAGVSAHLAVLTGIATAVIMAFLLIEPSPRWLLLLGAAAVVFGLDGTLRQTWRTPFSLGQETAPFLFVPALYMMAVPVLIEHNVSGELVFLVGLGAGFGFGALAWAEIASVRTQAPEYPQARVIVTANTYLTGFAIFSLSYVFEVGLPAAIAATSIAATMLAIEVLREGEIDPMETLGLSLVTGIVLGEARWLLYYMPLDTYLAGLTLLLVFYLVTGLLHSHVIRALNRVVAFEYSGIAAAGLALVILARAVGLA